MVMACSLRCFKVIGAVFLEFIGDVCIVVVRTVSANDQLVNLFKLISARCEVCGCEHEGRSNQVTYSNEHEGRSNQVTYTATNTREEATRSHIQQDGRGNQRRETTAK